MGPRIAPTLTKVVTPYKAQASLLVAIRVRPILATEVAKVGRKDIIRVFDGKLVVILDPDDTKDYLDQVQNRTKEKKYTFDVAFSVEAGNKDIYEGTIKELVGGIVNGLNGTVFAYGATGSGKTHTMVGTQQDPGLMVLSLQAIFHESTQFQEENVQVTCSYLEVYNEVIYDLLVKDSGPLELRENPVEGVQVVGITKMVVKSAREILQLLQEGNRRRKTDSTEANAASSRSHAVLEIVLKREKRIGYRTQHLIGRLSLVDLAGSERAAETNNAGQKLRDGANINRSLLALANCINALGKQQQNGVAYVPYRNSKLTRLLKDGLSGNSRTAMIATVSTASDQYHHSVNTLKYADRAKEIKTHVVQNVGSAERHLADYKRIIDDLQNEVQSLKSQLDYKKPAREVTAAELTSQPSAEADTLACIDTLVQETNENIEERINLQKALLELQDLNVINKYELKNVQDFIERERAEDGDISEAENRRSVLQQEVEENENAAQRYRSDIEANEQARREIQNKIEEIIVSNQNASFLKILSTFRIQAVRLQELKFQMAIRDQIIGEQKDIIINLWQILKASGLSKEQVIELAQQLGILMEAGSGESEGTLPDAVGRDTEASRNSDLDEPAGSMQLPPPLAGEDKLRLSLAGGRAGYRYRYWSAYQGHTGYSLASTPSATPVAPHPHGARHALHPTHHDGPTHTHSPPPPLPHLSGMGAAKDRDRDRDAKTKFRPYVGRGQRLAKPGDAHFSRPQPSHRAREEPAQHTRPWGPLSLHPTTHLGQHYGGHEYLDGDAKRALGTAAMAAELSGGHFREQGRAPQGRGQGACDHRRGGGGTGGGSTGGGGGGHGADRPWPAKHKGLQQAVTVRRSWDSSSVVPPGGGRGGRAAEVRCSGRTPRHAPAGAAYGQAGGGVVGRLLAAPAAGGGGRPSHGMKHRHARHFK